MEEKQILPEQAIHVEERLREKTRETFIKTLVRPVKVYDALFLIGFRLFGLGTDSAFSIHGLILEVMGFACLFFWWLFCKAEPFR